jgi:hypothetical protein
MVPGLEGQLEVTVTSGDRAGGAAPLHGHRAAGVALALLVGRHRLGRPRAIDRAAAAAVVAHTIPTEPVAGT